MNQVDRIVSELETRGFRKRETAFDKNVGYIVSKDVVSLYAFDDPGAPIVERTGECISYCAIVATSADEVPARVSEAIKVWQERYKGKALLPPKAYD